MDIRKTDNRLGSPAVKHGSIRNPDVARKTMLAGFEDRSLLDKNEESGNMIQVSFAKLDDKVTGTDTQPKVMNSVELPIGVVPGARAVWTEKGES